MKAALYARVSTKKRKVKQPDGSTLTIEESEGQDTENQLVQLRDYCQRQGWDVGHEYIDIASGKSTNGRHEFAKLMVDASKRMFDVVVVWALDRLTREGIESTFRYIRTLKEHGVLFESFTEAHFRTTGAAGELMLSVAAWIAEQERKRISERTKAGLDRARRAGKRLGPPKLVIDVSKLQELRAAGHSYGQIAEQEGLSKETVVRRLKSYQRAVAELALVNRVLGDDH